MRHSVTAKINQFRTAKLLEAGWIEGEQRRWLDVLFRQLKGQSSIGCKAPFALRNDCVKDSVLAGVGISRD